MKWLDDAVGEIVDGWDGISQNAAEKDGALARRAYLRGILKEIIEGHLVACLKNRGALFDERIRTEVGTYDTEAAE